MTAHGRYELVDGEIVAQAAPSQRHGTVQGALAMELGLRLRERNRAPGAACPRCWRPCMWTPAASAPNSTAAPPDGRWPDGPTVIIGDEPLTLETAGLTLPLSDLSPHPGLSPGER